MVRPTAGFAALLLWSLVGGRMRFSTMATAGVFWRRTSTTLGFVGNFWLDTKGARLCSVFLLREQT